jgi:UDP-glucose 4-epimerase
MHFAAHGYVSESVENPRKYFRNNVEAALTLLDTAIAAGVRTFVFSSSCAVYGAPSKIPITETESRQPINPPTGSITACSYIRLAARHGLSLPAIEYRG